MSWGGPGGSSQDTGRAAGRSMRARGGKARGERRIFGLGGACERAAQVIFGMGVGTWKAGAAETQHRSDLVGRDTAAQQALCDPQIGNTPVRWRETLRNLQTVQPTGINVAGSGGCKRTGLGSGQRRRMSGAMKWSGFPQRRSLSGQARLCEQQDGPGSGTARLTACWFLIGEPRQPSTMAPVRTGAICAVESCQMRRDGGSYRGIEWRQTDTNPSLQMAGAGTQNNTRLVAVGAHGFDDLVSGTIQIDENIAGIAGAGERVKEDVVTFAIAQAQEGHHGTTGELYRGPNPVAGKGLAGAAVNQPNLIVVARHSRQLAAHGLQGEEESAIHDRDSSIGSGTARLKAELFTLQKSGSFHFALTRPWGRLTRPAGSYIMTPP